MNEQVEELFHQLADLSPHERGAYLSAHNVDEDTRRQVAALLAFDSADNGPLDRGISDAASLALSSLDSTGDRCGPFRLERIIGRGGMGVVYLASRDDGEVAQRVAVKLLRPGLSSVQKERFFSERQILAGLDHPNIARLLDAGRLADGQPYLAMEFINGVPIHEFSKNLPLRGKIQLFCKVCDATAYLHRNLVVHRDLKPGNILVTAAGEPKLLDFGIAKLLDDTTDATVTGLRMLTPDYASPEQVLGERIGTASDIYSLGAVLYQLLTGHTPHDFADSSPGAVASAVARKEITQPSLWAPALKGDLDVILSKALRKEPAERYSSVEQLAGDLQAFLECRPVSARRGEALYRARKFARRYWLPVSAAVIAVAGLTIGLALAERERTIAQRRFDDVRQLSSKLFDIDLRVRDLQGSTQTRQFIVDTALAYLNRLAGDAHGDPALALDLGTAYMRVGRVQGVPISANLGQTDNAEANLQIAEGLIASLLKAQPNNRMACLRMAQILHDRMVLAQSRTPTTAALPLAERSRAWWDRYLDSGPVDDAEKAQVSIIGVNVANWLAQQDRLEAASQMLRRTIDVAQATGQPNYVGSAYITLTRIRRNAGDLDGALASSTDAVRLLEVAALHKDRGRIHAFGLALEAKGEVLATSVIGLGRDAEAAPVFAQCAQLADAEARQDPADVTSRFLFTGCTFKLGLALINSDPRRALAAFDDGLARTAEMKNNARSRRREVRLLAGAAGALRRLHRLPFARARIDLALTRLLALKIYPAPTVEPGSEAFELLRELAAWEAASGAHQRAIAAYTELRQKLERAGAAPEKELLDAVDLAGLLKAEALLLRSTAQPEAAGQLDRRRLDLHALWRQRKPGNLFVQKIWE